jgi:hypothetical protein
VDELKAEIERLEKKLKEYESKKWPAVSIK